MREFDFPVEISRPTPCDCYCAGGCPGPLVIIETAPGNFLKEMCCPRPAAYELTFDGDDGPSGSLMCNECTAAQREWDRKYDELVSIRSIPA